MMDIHRLYSMLPHPLRVLAANARGYYLRAWRYGRETERLVEEALERESWSPQRWKLWREKRLASILHRAATKVPYYRDYWSRKRRAGDGSSWELLENWPILEKEEVRRDPRAFVASDCDFRKMFCDHTSGTTGTPVSVYYTIDTLRNYHALYEARIRRWHGVTVKERWAILGGQQIVPVRRKKPPFWLFNAGLNQLYLSIYHLSAETAADYIEALRRFSPSHLVVYPSSAVILARAILEQKLPAPKIRVIYSNAETLLDNQRELMSEAFRCPVRNTYGMAEMVAAGSECEHGSMHCWPEVGVQEFFHQGDDVAEQGSGSRRLILTGLINPDMPFIRYDIGDSAVFENREDGCGCMRTLPILPEIEGRQNDLILTADGCRVYLPVSRIFHGLAIREAQVMQEKKDGILVRYVPAPGFTSSGEDLIAARLRNLLGELEVTMEAVQQVPRGANGKFRAVISTVAGEHTRITEGRLISVQ